MVFNRNSRAIATFSTLNAAGQALDRLVLAGFPIAQVSLVGENFITCEQNGAAEHLLHSAGSQTGDVTGTSLGLTKGLMAGNVLGGAAGVLLGLGILALPGIGQIAFTSAALFTLLSGGVGTAAGGVIGALVGLGLTEQQAKEYRQLIARGNYLLITSGTRQEIACAERILDAQSIRKQS